MATYFGATPDQARSVMNPYDYGYPVEVKVNNFSDATVAKHYAMGRIDTRAAPRWAWQTFASDARRRAVERQVLVPRTGAQ